MNNIPKHGHRLLKKQEVEEIYGIPKLSEKERKEVFHLNSHIKKILSSLNTLFSKYLFILQLGFFKVKKRFYALKELEKEEDIKRYIAEQYFHGIAYDKLSINVTNPTRLSHQSRILKIFQYRRCIGDVASLFKIEVERLTRTHANPSYVLRETIRFLERQKIIIPAYSTLQNVIGSAVQSEINRLSNQLNETLDEVKKKVLDDLIMKQGNLLNELTLLKKDPKDFSLKDRNSWFMQVHSSFFHIFRFYVRRRI